MLTNDQLDQWDRENFFHPSTHLAQHARGESPNRIVKTGSGVYVYAFSAKQAGRDLRAIGKCAVLK